MAFMSRNIEYKQRAPSPSIATKTCSICRLYSLFFTSLSFLAPNQNSFSIGALEVLTNVIAKSVFLLLPEMWLKLRTQIFVYLFTLSFFSRFVMYSSAPTVGSWWSQRGEMTASCSHPWWSWWSDTLWVTLPTLWLHSFLIVFVLVWLELTQWLPSKSFCGDFSPSHGYSISILKLSIMWVQIAGEAHRNSQRAVGYHQASIGSFAPKEGGSIKAVSGGEKADCKHLWGNCSNTICRFLSGWRWSGSVFKKAWGV